MTSGVSALTVLISVLSSATVGGIIVALLTGRQERDQQLREKMLSTASDFATSVAKLHSQLRLIDRAQERRVLGAEARQTALAQYEVIWEEAETQRVLLQILYHPASSVYAEAGNVWARTPDPDEARDYVGDPTARRKAIAGGGLLTAKDLMYLADFSYHFAVLVWEALDNPRRRRGRRALGLAAHLRRPAREGGGTHADPSA
jgi:hypothetical protein